MANMGAIDLNTFEIFILLSAGDVASASDTVSNPTK